MNQSKQTVLITGGSSGIGLALAKKFLENDNVVIITGRNFSKLEDVQKELPEIQIFQCDVTDQAEVDKLAIDIDQQFGGIDILVNNAGIMNLIDAGNESNDLQKQMQEIDINFSSPIRVLHSFLPQLKKSENGVLVNVSSGLAYVPLAQAAVYSGTKAALHFWTRGIRPQLKPHHIKVIELLPPVVDTPLAQEAEITEDENIKPMSPENLVDKFWEGFIQGKEEITPGDAKLLKLMSRISPNFIFKKLNHQPIPKK